MVGIVANQILVAVLGLQLPQLLLLISLDFAHFSQQTLQIKVHSTCLVTPKFHKPLM
ncbi:hypothetical protein MtrunA17_Chr4g0012421 [Medicago truncatula]|uniref:Uncharacterized protein n=1 Tax=Medicago truncatula TaxID=3880 RepID=A0A396I161_MEDTR|nr:hypothetical protein MtrunA17_Chr4g0012421 [Medicago truncatula]